MYCETEQEDMLFSGMEKVNGFYNLDDILNTSGGKEDAVITRMRTEWLKFKECGEILYEKRFLMNIKRKFT